MVEKVKSSGSVKQQILMGISALEEETLTREYRLALTLSFAPSIKFNYQIVGFHRGSLNDTDRNISNDETS